MTKTELREKLVELMKAQPCLNSDCYYCEENGAYCELYKMADILIANGVTINQWIPVTERLPNVNTNKSGYERKGVIVCIDGCATKSVYRIYERACNRGKTVHRWKYPWDTISNENITHWMSLPEPPKEE